MIEYYQEELTNKDIKIKILEKNIVDLEQLRADDKFAFEKELLKQRGIANKR